MTDVASFSIRDDRSGAVAKIAPALGFNCHSFEVSSPVGPLELLWTAPRFLSGVERASSSGIPLLFPFPGRLEGTRLDFDGHTFPLKAGDGIGNAIHGFVLDRPWRVIEHTQDRIVGRFHASDVDADLANCWPSDWQLDVEYAIDGTRLTCRVNVKNVGGARLPFGFGSHGYFRVPLGGAGSAADYRVVMPARSYFELSDMLPTGRVLPATGDRALGDGLRFVDTRLDDVFTDLEFETGVCHAVIEDITNRRRVVVEFDGTCPICVVYNPPHREAICIEPYTCVPDAYRLSCHAIDTGLRILEPEQTFATTFAVAFYNDAS